MPQDKILIVEDEAKALKFLEIELVNAGYCVITAATGRQALDQAKDGLPRLILMDIMLPDITGADVARSLRADPVTAGIPILFLTAMLRKKEEQECHLGLNIDNTWYRAIAKPFNHVELLREIKTALLT